MKQSNRASFLEAFSKTKGHYVGGKKTRSKVRKGGKTEKTLHHYLRKPGGCFL